MKKSKLVFVFNKLGSSYASHFAHIHQFLPKLSIYFDLFVIVETGFMLNRKQFDFPIYIQKRRNIFLRVFELLVLLRDLNQKGYKAIYIHYSYGASLVSFFFQLFYKITVFLWNCEENHYNKKPIWFIWHKFRSEIPTYISISCCDYLITGTETMRRYYSEHYKKPLEKILVIPNYINTNIEFSKSSPKIPCVLFVHHLAPRKGSCYLKDIFLGVKAEIPNVKMKIIGDGPDFDFLKRQILADNSLLGMELIGSVTNDKVNEYFKEATIFIMPSNQEGFPRVLLESMLYQTPFVAFNVGGTADILSRPYMDYLIPRYHIKEFIHKCIELLRNTDKQIELIKEGQKIVKQYDIQTVADVFYREIGPYVKE